MLGAHAVERLALKLGELLALGEGLGHRLAVQLAELGFEVEGLQMGRSARHAEEDDALDLGRQVRREAAGQVRS